MIDRNCGIVKVIGLARKNTELRRNVIGLVICLLIAVIGLFLLIYGSFGQCDIELVMKSGFYGENVMVSIRPTKWFWVHPMAIKYNLDGDDLSVSSQVYESEIELEVPETGYKFYTITAIACKENNECSEPKTASYVLGKDLKNDVTLKIINVNSSRRDLYDYERGIMVKGATYDYNERVGNINGGYIAGNYNNRGDKWARDAYITAFDIDGSLIEDSKGTIEISGGTSSSYTVKSLKVTIPADDASMSSEEFRLRSGSQDQFSGNVRSSVASRLIEESGFDGGASTERVVVFLNGEFYGIFDKQENYSKRNLATKYNISKKKFIKKYKSSEDGVYGLFELDNDIWHDLDKQDKREQLEKIIDMDNYLYYYAIQVLLNNTDWPMNNFEGWRYEGQKSDNLYEDGRIRFLLYDTDLIYYTDKNIQWFDGAIGDSFENLMERKGSGRESTFYYVMESEYYKEKFIKIVDELIKGPFLLDNILNIIDEEVEKIDHQMELFYSPSEYENWKKQIAILKRAVYERDDRLREDMIKYLKVDLEQR